MLPDARPVKVPLTARIPYRNVPTPLFPMLAIFWSRALGHFEVSGSMDTPFWTLQPQPMAC